MGRIVLIWAILSIQLLGCLSKDCPEFRKDVQWKGIFGKGDIRGSTDPKSARACQQSCQEFSKWDASYRNFIDDYPCVGWSFWAEPGPWSDSSWCSLFGNTTGGEPLQNTAISAPGAVSGLKNDCETGKGPTIAEYLLEGVASLNLNKTNWKYIMAEDTDIDQDGDVSDIELEHKFGSYMEELFKMMDQDKNNIVTEEELESLRVDLPGINKILDAVFESYPVKSTLLMADGNRDGVLDESDFYLPAKPFFITFQGPPANAPASENEASGSEDIEASGSGESPTGSGSGSGAGAEGETSVTLSGGNNDAEGKVNINNDGVVQISQNEGNVICHSLGFKGLNKLVTNSDRGRVSWAGTLYGNPTQKYTCDGTEERLEDCAKEKCPRYYCGREMGVICEDEIGSLRLVGGKDASSGDIFLGNKGLGCALYRCYGPHCGEDWHQKQSEVICRELGFAGFVKTTRQSTFTQSVRPTPTFISKQFRCKGDEKKLMDCPMENAREACYAGNIQGIVCNKKDGGSKMVENKFLGEITSWRSIWKDWELMGRFLFIADENNDGKLSSEEIIAKAKQYLKTMFNFMDQTRDGFVSIKDFTSPHMTVGPIHQVIDTFFEKTDFGEIDLIRPIIMGIDVMDFTGSNGDLFDRNNDTKLNADDSYLLGKYLGLGKEVHLIPVLSKKMDKNQDGKLQRQEVRDFVDYIFKKLDIDEDGALTFEDAFGHMKENGVSCLSILEWRSFLPRFTGALETQFGAMMKYLFKELDEDRNGEIGLKEFQQLHVPCALSRKEVDIDPSRIRCYKVDRHFSRPLQTFRFPRLPFTGGNRDGGPGSSEDEMAEIACKMLS